MLGGEGIHSYVHKRLIIVTRYLFFCTISALHLVFFSGLYELQRRVNALQFVDGEAVVVMMGTKGDVVG